MARGDGASFGKIDCELHQRHPDRPHVRRIELGGVHQRRAPQRRKRQGAALLQEVKRFTGLRMRDGELIDDPALCDTRARQTAARQDALETMLGQLVGGNAGPGARTAALWA